MNTEPAGWTPADEDEYQAYLKRLQCMIDVAGPSDDIGILLAAREMLSDENTGRFYYVKSKANGWL